MRKTPTHPDPCFRAAVGDAWVRVPGQTICVWQELGACHTHARALDAGLGVSRPDERILYVSRSQVERGEAQVALVYQVARMECVEHVRSVLEVVCVLAQHRTKIHTRTTKVFPRALTLHFGPQRKRHEATNAGMVYKRGSCGQALRQGSAPAQGSRACAWATRSRELAPHLHTNCLAGRWRLWTSPPTANSVARAWMLTRCELCGDCTRHL